MLAASPVLAAVVVTLGRAAGPALPSATAPRSAWPELVSFTGAREGDLRGFPCAAAASPPPTGLRASPLLPGLCLLPSRLASSPSLSPVCPGESARAAPCPAAVPAAQEAVQRLRVFFLRCGLPAAAAHSLVWGAAVHLLQDHSGTQPTRMLAVMGRAAEAT